MSKIWKSFQTNTHKNTHHEGKTAVEVTPEKTELEKTKNEKTEKSNLTIEEMKTKLKWKNIAML